MASKRKLARSMRNGCERNLRSKINTDLLSNYVATIWGEVVGAGGRADGFLKVHLVCKVGEMVLILTNIGTKEKR